MKCVYINSKMNRLTSIVVNNNIMIGSANHPLLAVLGLNCKRAQLPISG